MTSAEWMMLVLSIYFHDMGMLISKMNLKIEIRLISQGLKARFITVNLVRIILPKLRV